MLVANRLDTSAQESPFPPRAETQARQNAVPNYQLVHIRIFNTDTPEDGYPVELRVPDGRDFPQGRLQLDQAALLALNVRSDAYGRALGEALFAKTALGDAYSETLAVFQSQEQRMRVRLRIDAPALHALRWERIHHTVSGTWFPMAATSDTLLSRYVPVQAWEQPQALRTQPLRTLVVLASPPKLERYGLEALSSAALSAWHAAFDAQAGLDVTYLESSTAKPPTLNQIREALAGEHPGGGIHLLHIVCHGMKRGQDTVLYLEDEDGEATPVHSAQILELLRASTTRPHLCFLAACESGASLGEGETEWSGEAFLALGPALVAEAGVPAVVAMAERVGIVTAQQFAERFYERLIKHGIVDLAVQEARARVRERWDWSVPVLFSRLPSNRLLEAAEAGDVRFEDVRLPDLQGDSATPCH